MVRLAAPEREAKTSVLRLGTLPRRNAAELASDPGPIRLFLPRFRVVECLDEIKECLEKGWTGIGFKTRQIESAWKDYTGHEHAHFVASATAGLHLAIRVLKDRLGWRETEDVVTTPLTFVSTNHAILYERLRPVFADVDESLCLDPDSVAERMTPRTRAVVFVGLGGNCGQYSRIVELCRTRGLPLVLDAAHMAGTRLDGRHVGLQADAAVYSFNAVKNLPTADSGMICFRDGDDDARARKLSCLGINRDTYSRTTAQGSYDWRYEVEDVGYKYYGNSIMAAIALVQLRYLDRDNAYRRQLAACYENGFAEAKAISMPPIAQNCEPSRHLFQIRVRNRDEVMLVLRQHQIGAGVHYKDNTDYRMYAFGHGTCPRAQKASREIISLPLHLSLTSADVSQVCQLIKLHAQV
jgi:dTDP-4-amino-4,6-dideoxygalactose transaminase